jgi:hypoxanthine phosphoribosyltransferase
MPDQSEAPFHSIESAIEYLDQLLASAQEAQKEVEMETLRAADPDQARRKHCNWLILNWKSWPLTSSPAAES